MTLELEQRLARCRERVKVVLDSKERWKQLAMNTANQLAGSIILPGHYRWPQKAERWRSPIDYWMLNFGQTKYLDNRDWLLDMMVGISWYETAQTGDPYSICGVEWVGEPPPGYDPNDDATKASGLFQIPPAYWPARSRAAGFEGKSIFDANANIGTACWLLWDGWHKETAPNWRHWSAAHVGKRGSYEKVLDDLNDRGYYNGKGP